MKTFSFSILGCLMIFLLDSCSRVPPPAPVGPLPSERQLAWHEMQFYAFVHFNMNTFTDMEWGFGSESPKTFNPSALDCHQWAKVCKDAGMKGIIITAKHHDGFCLWPSKYTEHSVKNSPWKNGKGDVVKELADACREYGLKLGIYLSPWDRNHADYGKPEYITYFRNQLIELLTGYGEVFEVWFDGANGGTGYYGGANENRHVDRETYYDWDSTWALVRSLQPNAVMFSDAGPDVRWVGNEAGWAGKTNWCTLRRDEFYPGSPGYKQLTKGHEDGTHWVPAEVDVSIRPGWYYHQSEDHKVKSLKQLVDIYYHSIGRNASFLLNFPVDARGLIHERDVEQLNKMANQIRNDFQKNLAGEMTIEASNVRGNDRAFRATHVLDTDPETYWAADDSITSATLVLAFEEPTAFNRFLISEYIPLGQRVKAFSLEYWGDGEWRTISRETTIGGKRILRFPTCTAEKIRVNILDSKACPVISGIEIYNAPKLLAEPAIRRNKEGIVSMEAFDDGLDIFYTLDGSEPSTSSTKYEKPFIQENKVDIRAMAYDPQKGNGSAVTTRQFDICKAKWRIVRPAPQANPDIEKIIDDHEGTVWSSDRKEGLPYEIVIDLGEQLDIAGFTYLPTQGRWLGGTIEQFEVYISPDGKNWGAPISAGEFSNIKNNPILQSINFEQTKGRFMLFKGLRDINNEGFCTIAELGLITK